MNKELGIRFALVGVVVALEVLASEFDFHNSVVAPASVVLVALIMFWPRWATSSDAAASTRDELRQVQEEARR